MALSNQEVYLGDFRDEAAKRMGEYGQTRMFSTGVSRLDRYLGGGFGRMNGYEIILLFGPSKIGKSTIALNLVAPAVKDEKRVGLMVLEDEGPDTYNRLAQILGSEDTKTYLQPGSGIRCLPVDAMLKSWSLDDLLKRMEDWFESGIDVILLDHIQFAFENAETAKGENEYTKQRVFMQKLNHLMKKVHKTLIIVSHTAKNGAAAGMDKVMGSSAIAAAATKIIEVKKDKLGVLYLHMHGSRFTTTPDVAFPVALSGEHRVKLEDGLMMPPVEATGGV